MAKTFTITVPYTATYTVSNVDRIYIEEDELLDHFEVDSLEEISKEDLAEYFQSQAEDLDISRSELASQFAEEVANNRTDFEVQSADIEILEEEDTAGIPVFWNV